MNVWVGWYDPEPGVFGVFTSLAAGVAAAKASHTFAAHDGHTFEWREHLGTLELIHRYPSGTGSINYYHFTETPLDEFSDLVSWS